MPSTLAHGMECQVTGVVLVCYRDGRKVFRPYLPAQDASRYEFGPTLDTAPDAVAAAPLND